MTPPCIANCNGAGWSKGVVNRQNDDRFTVLSPEDRQKKQDMDSLLAEAMRNLTFEQQQEQLEGLHGVASPLSEDQETVEYALQHLDGHLNTIKRGSAYFTAECRSKEYVRDRSLRMMFLRANRYDAKAAADQMLRFFEAKQILFGAKKLVTDITMKDLDEDDLACLRTGCIQLPGKDQANRQIILQVVGLRNFRTLENELRVRYYMTMQALKSEEVQLNGAVAVRYGVGDLKDGKNGEGYLEHIRLRKSLPIRYEGVHVCSDDPRQVLLASVALTAMGPRLRARYRIHHGSHMECLYLLGTYGISSKILNLSMETYEINLEHHLNWFQSCLMDDMGSHPTAVQPPKLTTETKDNDALFICCKKSRSGGNDRLRVLVKEMADIYDAGSNEKKRKIVDQMAAEIQNEGGKFLQHVKGSDSVWEVLPQKEIRSKITQIFRNYRRSNSKQKVRQRGLIVHESLPNDVVFGKNERNRGTNLLHCLIKDRFDEYEALDRGTKLTLVDFIVRQLKDQGSRFLQPNEDQTGYIELSDDLVRTRVSKYFANHRRLVRKSR